MNWSERIAIILAVLATVNAVVAARTAHEARKHADRALTAARLAQAAIEALNPEQTDTQSAQITGITLGQRRVFTVTRQGRSRHEQPLQTSIWGYRR
jgi:hypothetical protein